MVDDNKLVENIEYVKNNFEYEENMRKIREEIVKKFAEYRKTLNYMAADAPIETLCLPTAIQNALLDHGCLRIYDLFDLDFAKVKGLGTRRIGDLTTCLNKFLSMF